MSNTTSYQYDGLNRLTVETNELEKSRFYQYDASGNRTRMIDRNGRVRLFNYDALNRIAAEKWMSGTNVMKTIASTYDAAGQLIQVGDDVSRYTYTYDLLGRLKSVDNVGTPGGAPVKFAYDYDSEGSLISVTDAINGVTQATTAYEYDKLDRITQITQSGTGVQSKRVDFDYDRIGLMKQIARFTGLDGTGKVATTRYSYDNLNRLEQIRHQNAVGGVLEQFDYGYDEDDRITSITDLQRTVNYDYLADDQLIGANYSDTTTDENYSYDANGNRLDNQTDSDNQLRSDGRYLYSYDDEGNLRTQTEIATSKMREFVWDYRNRLVEVIDRSGSTVSQQVNYTYNTLNQRVVKQVDADGDGSQAASTTRFVYDRNHVTLEFTGTATTPNQRYLYGVQTDQILAQETNGVTTWYLADQLGSVRILVDSSGAISNRYTYDSFGKLIGFPNSTVDTRYRYTGREWDSETGLYYYRSRYYNADTGKFIGKDPLSFEAKDPNLYRYTHNSPVMSVDPSGMVKIELVFNPLVSILIPTGFGVSNLSYNHAFIRITDCFDKKQYFYRGGPQNDFNTEAADKYGFGPIVTQHGRYVKGSKDWKAPNEQITKTLLYQEKVSMNSYHVGLANSLQRTERSNIKYKMFGPNSNSTVSQALQDIRLGATLPYGVEAPGWGMNLRDPNLEREKSRRGYRRMID